MNKKGFHEIAPYDRVSEKPFDFSAWTHRSGAAPSHHSTMPTDPTSKITGEAVASAYLTMRGVDNRIRERTPSQCLIPRDDGNGRAVVDCARDTQRSHTVQEAVLRMIASGKTPSVITFVPIDSQILANASKGEDGSLWSTLPWDLPSLPLKLEPIQTASTRHFSCNRCDSDTFRQIEHTPIEWPKWPQVLVINELETDGHDPLFSHQMFLLAYRCLIKEICFARGSMTSTLHRLENEEMDPPRANTNRGALPVPKDARRTTLAPQNEIRQAPDGNRFTPDDPSHCPRQSSLPHRVSERSRLGRPKVS